LSRFPRHNAPKMASIVLLRESMTLREEFHRFIDELEDDVAKPGLHAGIEKLQDDLIPAALDRMRSLRAQRSGTT
jgi:hypothetical protein